MAAPPPKPTAARATHGATTLELGWPGDVLHRLPHRLLRGYCPCAGCQGHEGSIKFVKPSSDIMTELDKIDPVGNYALQLTWFDGHSSGLYSYKYLRALCHCDECRPGAAKEERGELPRS